MLNQWTPVPPKQDPSPDGYGTRCGGLVTVQDDRWACSGCGKAEAASDAHHAAQLHAADCRSTGFTSKEN